MIILGAKSFVLEFAKNSIYDNCNNTYILSTFSCVTACNFAIIFKCIYAKTPYDDHYNFFISGTGRSIASKFCKMKCETALDFTNKFSWCGKKYLFTAMQNVVQFSRSIGTSVFNLFSNYFFNDNFLGFWAVNNFVTLHMYSRSIK